jgi:5-methylcytosine-specific restriction endonuclease McrA
MAVQFKGKKFSRVKDAVFFRDGYKCVVCGDADITYDHIIPKSRGGLRTIQNGQTLCMAHNLQKGNQDDTEWKKGLNGKAF